MAAALSRFPHAGSGQHVPGELFGESRDQVTFGDVVVGLTAPDRGPHDPAGLPEPLGARGSAGERRVVVDEAGSDVAVDGREVALREELLD